MKSSELEKFIENHCHLYDVVVIGKSVLGENIYAVNKEFDKSFKWVLVTAGIHAREHLSCDLVCELIKKMRGKKLGYNISFVPLINPDGANLCLGGISFLQKNERKRLIEINDSKDFSLYKANANGVDLNNNWDANWDMNFKNKTAPASQGFYGNAPMSEPEVQCLASWVKKLDLFLTISYHLKGEEVYFDFFQDERRYERDKTIAKVFSKSTGYKIKSTQNVSSGGFKDWCVQELKIPALTIELGNDRFSHPFPKEQLATICKQQAHFFEDVQKSLEVFNAYED